MRPLVIIEHDPDFARELRVAVEEAGFQTESFDDPAAALPDLRRNAYALAIVDVDRSDASEICNEASRLVPVIAVTAQCSEDVCVQMFEAGADECLARPIPARELGARVRNVLRRAGTNADQEGELSQSLSAMRVESRGRTYDLSHGEAEVLAVLAHAAGAPLTITQILERLPAEARVKPGTISSRIKSLRRKLGADRLVTRGGFGYALADER